MPKNYDFSTGFYRCPSPSLLTMPERDEWEVEETSKIIEETLKQLGMEVEVSGAEEGPVVTMYKIRLGSGVRVEAVLGTARELKTALGGKNIRFVDSIPGEPCIGIEVPNDKRGEIGLESIIGNPAFFDSFNSLPISLEVFECRSFLKGK